MGSLDLVVLLDYVSDELPQGSFPSDLLSPIRTHDQQFRIMIWKYNYINANTPHILNTVKQRMI